MEKLVSIIMYVFLLLFMQAAGPEEIVSAGAQTTLPVEEEKYVALTFDDGPHQGTTQQLLDGLQEREAKATFFLIGQEIPGKEDLVKSMAAQGHQVGNHTWGHVSLKTGTTAQALEEVEKTDALLQEILGEDVYWLRPPYGSVPDTVASQIQVPMVKWSVDPRDWESRDKEKIVQAVLEAVKPNSIILLHDIYPTSVEAALEIVDTLQAEGYTFVTVEELLQINGIAAQKGTLYISGRGGWI